MSSNNEKDSADEANNQQRIHNEDSAGHNTATRAGGDNYIYRDFADVPCSDPQPRASHLARNKLPAKLNAILSDPGELTHC